MPKWEYKTETIAIDSSGKKNFMYFSSYFSEERMLETLGKQGWELVNVTVSPGASVSFPKATATYYFKRLVNE
jgi:hypothetical protein